MNLSKDCQTHRTSSFRDTNFTEKWSKMMLFAPKIKHNFSWHKLPKIETMAFWHTNTTVDLHFCKLSLFMASLANVIILFWNEKLKSSLLSLFLYFFVQCNWLFIWNSEKRIIYSAKKSMSVTMKASKKHHESFKVRYVEVETQKLNF